MKKVLVLIDIQREYNSPGRPFSLNGIEPSLAKAKSMLDSARASGVPVIHVRHLQAGGIFNPETDFSKFIAGFEPLASEVEVHKGNFSCFSSPEFTKLLETHRDSEVVLAGYGSTMCCLSTMIDGYHRGFKMTFANDASLAKRTTSFDEPTLHLAMGEVLATFGRVASAEEFKKEIVEQN